MSRRAELPQVVQFVRKQVLAMAPAYDEIGLRVTAIEADADNGEPFPDLLIFVERKGVDGERVARYSLEHNGDLQGPGDAAVSIAYWALERQPPRSNAFHGHTAPTESPERPEISENVPMGGIITAHGRYVR
jgi:hypothetical protein